MVKAFNTSVYACYQKYETDFKIRNRIPSNYSNNLNYDCSCDEFITSLNELQFSVLQSATRIEVVIGLV